MDGGIPVRLIDVAPKPSALLESMREIGYTLSTALADLIDNSISARAKHIQIFAKLDGPEPAIGILDNGLGMSEDELHSAMRFGSRSPLDPRSSDDLGRFGLGLKTASISQCRVLTVVSRDGRTTSCATWNLDRITSTEKWQVEIPTDYSQIPWASELGATGTLVVWSGLGSRLGPLRESQVDEYWRQFDEARAHLELVFHRFIAGDLGTRKIRLEINGYRLSPIDPFQTNHPATIAGPIERIGVAGGHVAVRPFTLPHRDKVSTEEWEQHGGRMGYLRTQGLYVYREKRLIIHGTWFGLARQTELTKLARVRVDIPNTLDLAWKIDVLKASAQLPSTVRDRLRRIIQPLGAPSKRAFTTRGRRLTDTNPLPVWNRIQQRNHISYRMNADHPVIRDILKQLPNVARKDFSRFIEIAGSSLPLDALHSDFGDGSDSVTSSPMSKGALQYAAIATYRHLIQTSRDRSVILEIMSSAEPFRSRWDEVERTLGSTFPGD